MPTSARVIEWAGGVFVTGTGTGVGKTVVSACLISALGGDYWKPVQTGCLEDTGSDGDGRTPKQGGCGCTTGTPMGGSLWMLLLAGGLVRRRRAA